MRRTVAIEEWNLRKRRCPALLIVGHGSRDPRGAREFHDLVDLVRGRNPSLTVEGGFIELSRPPISECVDRLAESGARNVAAVPLMLLAAGHAKDDIPATLVREKMGHPEMSFSYGRALGIRPELLELMDERISAVVLEEEKEETQHPYRRARLLRPRRQLGPLQDSAPVLRGTPLSRSRECLRQHDPARCRERAGSLPQTRREARRGLLLLPLHRRPRGPYPQAEQSIRPRRTPASRCATQGTHGPDELADLVVERYTEAVRGDIRMNCDVCVHRVALPGFEEKVGAPATPHYHPTSRSTTTTSRGSGGPFTGVRGGDTSAKGPPSRKREGDISGSPSRPLAWDFWRSSARGSLGWQVSARPS